MGKTPWRLMDCRGQHDVAHPTASRIIRLRSSDGPQFGSLQAPTQLVGNSRTPVRKLYTKEYLMAPYPKTWPRFSGYCIHLIRDP